MLVKWSYLTKSYFAGKILTDYLEQNDNYSEVRWEIYNFWKTLRFQIAFPKKEKFILQVEECGKIFENQNNMALGHDLCFLNVNFLKKNVFLKMFFIGIKFFSEKVYFYLIFFKQELYCSERF